ncbi:hypothetical protein [Thiohalocapsa sp. ML1]|jgi:hypothetical protein|uniref:hypothetical protein n=1 Tax=Thiohalocapsa sp. ML1 TaxID=1431688 RepID=UPI0012E3471C|nr:hypothetical protein [Thiohalocapsa sp. ML1]
MAMTTHEPDCVALKRRGAEHVARLIAGMTVQEQLAFWDKRTEALRRRQEQKRKLEAEA